MSTTGSAPKHVYEVYIRTTPERLWQALVDPELTERYFFNSRIDSTWEKGAPYRMTIGAGAAQTVPVWGEVLEIDAPHRLVQSFEHDFGDGAPAEPASRVTWEIEEFPGACKLRVVHDQLEHAPHTAESTGGGWPIILSCLKTLLETGDQLIIGIEV